MKVTVDLSPYEIQKLGKLTNADYTNCWNKMIHTTDDIAFSIHQLINMIKSLNQCDDDCENCECKDECEDYNE